MSGPLRPDHSYDVRSCDLRPELTDVQKKEIMNRHCAAVKLS